MSVHVSVSLSLLLVTHHVKARALLFNDLEHLLDKYDAMEDSFLDFDTTDFLRLKKQEIIRAIDHVMDFT